VSRAAVKAVLSAESRVYSSVDGTVASRAEKTASKKAV
jgi:hypothetical protein